MTLRPQEAPKGRYRTTRLVSRNERALIYEAQDEVFGRTVVIKCSAINDQVGVDALEREADILRRLDHPNNLQLLDYCTCATSELPARFLVLEHLAGGSLRDVFFHTRRLAPLRAVNIAAQVLLALAEAHGHSVIHGDVKPENVLFLETGGLREVVKLADYHCSQPLRRHGREGSAGTTVHGTPPYVAPEVLAGRIGELSADLFSVGVLLYEMLAGQRPYRARSYDALRAEHAAHRVTPLNHLAPVGKALSHIVTRAMDLDPKARFGSAPDFIDALSALDVEELAHAGGGYGSSAEDQEQLVTPDGSTLHEVEVPPAPETVELPRLRSSQDRTAWVLEDDPALSGFADRPEYHYLAERLEVRFVLEHERELLADAIGNGTVDPPWLVVFGAIGPLLEDPLLARLASEPETSKVLIAADPNAALLDQAINWCGVDAYVAQPATSTELEQTFDDAIARSGRVRQRLDTLRLARYDAAMEREEVPV